MKKSKGGKVSEVDMMSNLPDPILHLILSRIPTTEEVARTSILSTRWKYLWTAVPSLDIDYYRGGQKAPQEFTKDNFNEFVCRVLANQSIHLESFRLCCGNQYSMSTVKGWIDAAVKRNEKLLGLKFCRPEREYDVMELPRCVVTCGSLEELRLSLSGRCLILPKVSGFSALRVLELKTCILLTADSLKDFLESCQLLEDLSLVNCTTVVLPVLCISCPKLKKLRIDNGNIYDSEHSRFGYQGMCDSLEICCPNLVYLELVGRVAHDHFIFENLDSLKKAVIHPEDRDRVKVCELLSGISHVESLSLHLCFTEQDSSSPTQVPDVDFPSGHVFEQLKTVKMKGGMTGAVHEIGFIKFLLGSSPVLETITISSSMDMTDENLRILTDDVVKFPRASPEAGILFVQD